MDNRKPLSKCCEWSWEQKVYVIFMHILIVSCSLAACLFITHNDIPMRAAQKFEGFVILSFYISFALLGLGGPDSSSEYDNPLQII
ncbi:unnamed protein product [Microthlaspi erraticum]|uniref:Uncharacterized protein n=1 Tax=Microthlaspi erraticum TaxID=1685480 RepID=A0A6D2K2H4_9BRAS|nr:unnamed protein product [Microthlaspi erraticum]